jgi:hypothetical protein
MSLNQNLNQKWTLSTDRHGLNADGCEMGMMQMHAGRSLCHLQVICRPIKSLNQSQSSEGLSHHKSNLGSSEINGTEGYITIITGTSIERTTTRSSERVLSNSTRGSKINGTR